MRVAGFILLFALLTPGTAVEAADLAALKAKAAKGDAGAQYQLAEIHHEAIAVAQDLPAARRWATQATDQGHARAQYRLASMQLLGEGGPRDAKAAMALFKQCLPALTKEAENGVADAQGKLGILYARGVAVEKDFDAAVGWFRKAATQGNPKAQADLAAAYLTGQGVEANPTLAGDWFTRAAQAGHVPAMIPLATLQLQGRGCRQDVAAGKRWLEQAAAGKNPGHAQRARTLLERVAKNAPRKLPDMDALATRAGEGNLKAQLELAQRHESGEGLPVDLVRAAQWYRLAAGQGSGLAAHRMGGMMALGRGLKKDTAQAASYWSLAARLGYAGAQIDWGVMCGKGEGTPRNPARAYYWFLVAQRSVTSPKQRQNLDHLQAVAASEMEPDDILDQAQAARRFVAPEAPALRRAMVAAAHGDGAAQFELGQALAEGTGLAKDVRGAFVWLSLAAKQKVKNAATARDALGLSEKEKAAALKEVKAFKPLPAPKG